MGKEKDPQGVSEARMVDTTKATASSRAKDRTPKNSTHGCLTRGHSPPERLRGPNHLSHAPQPALPRKHILPISRNSRNLADA